MSMRAIPHLAAVAPEPSTWINPSLVATAHSKSGLIPFRERLALAPEDPRSQIEIG